MAHRILLIDDDDSVLVGLTNALQSEGYDVVPAASSLEGRGCLHAEPRVDLVLLDLGLPDTSGWDFLKYAASTRPDMPVIIITAQPDQYWAAWEGHAAALMEKPLDIQMLLTVMTELLRETPERRIARTRGESRCLHYSASGTLGGAWS